MTEETDRIDFGVLRLLPGEQHTEAIIATVMQRVRADRRDIELLELSDLRRGILAAASVLTAIAAAVLVMWPVSPVVSSSDSVGQWIEREHVPSNAELLAAFAEYQP